MAFRAWHEVASESRRQRQVCTRTVLRLMRRKVAMALAKWVDVYYAEVCLALYA